MRYEELTEASREVQPTNFGLDDPARNQAFVRKNLPRVVEVIEQTPDYEIARTGDGQHGWIFLYNKRDQTVDYVVQYATRNWPWLANRSVTQCLLWRDDTSPFVGGITKRMFFDYLLPRYGIIISDRLQTAGGHDFWRRRMTDAVANGFRVGVAYLNEHHVRWYDAVKDGGYRGWLQAQDTYGSQRKHEAIRYVIAQH